MVRAKESQTFQQFSAKNPPDWGAHMAFPQLDQNYNLPFFPPSTFTSNIAIPGHAPDLRACQENTVGGFPKSCWDISYPNRNPYVKDSHFALTHGHGVTDTKPLDAASQRRFLIFDQSGNHTRLFVSPSFPQMQIIASSKTDAFFANGSCEKWAKPIVEEKWDENDLSDGEGEMLEDTEEINALLYSDDEYDDDGENDEVTSTRHTPFVATEEGYEKDKFLLEEIIEEVASSDDYSPKRQRLLDGRYKKPSLVSLDSPSKRANTNTCNYEDDVESSCAGGSSADSSKREKKVNVRNALKILESIIPGLKTNDPLSIIDHAIGYLKSMKTEAEALGLGYAEGDSVTLL